VADTYYITTPIYYVNDLPHIGHIYTTVMADIFARYKRLRGCRVYFLTGTDEHGQKIEKAAHEQGMAPVELANRVVARYHEYWRDLNISNDDFIRTTEPRHQRGVAEIIRRITAAGDIYKGEYTGWYCPGCEAYYPESKLVDGRCPDQGHEVEMLSEASHFFRLSAYQERLLDYYRSNPGCIRPAAARNEVISFVESGLRDLSISRASLSWGVPFPDDPEHVVYVWLDALTNYISALGFGSDEHGPYDDFWPATIHLVGKDILRFHCVYWPAFLMSAGLEPPQCIFGHGWWTRDERKMSKSFGNVARPDHLVERFGADPLRYFLAREMTFGLDANYSDQAFVERYNTDLANNLGNAVSRVLNMAGRYLGGRVPPRSAEGVIPGVASDTWTAYIEAMEAMEPHRALEAVWRFLDSVNLFVQERKPWELAKAGEQAQVEAVLYTCLEALRIASVLIDPFMPTVAASIRDQLGVREDGISLTEMEEWGQLPEGAKLGSPAPLFPRVDIDEFLKEITMEQPETGAQTQDAPTEKSDQITIDELMRVRMVVGLVKEAERVPKSKKLVRLMVDLGEPEPRQLVAGIAERYTVEELVGRRIVVIANLKPAKLMGVESQGMLLAATVDGDPFLLAPDQDVPPGSPIR